MSPNDNFNRIHTIFKCIKGMLYIKLHKVFPTKLTNFFLRTDYKFQNLMAPLDSLQNGTRLRLNGSLEGVKLSLAGECSWWDFLYD